MAPRGGKKIIIVKKKIAGHGGHHGGSWKVAYADFVTAMMAFFMVMWILGMDDKTKQAIEGYFANPVGYKKGYGAGSSPLSTGTAPTNVQNTPLRVIVRSTEQRTFEQLKNAILEKVASNDSLKALKALVDVQVTNDGLRIELVLDGRHLVVEVQQYVEHVEGEVPGSDRPGDHDCAALPRGQHRLGHQPVLRDDGVRVRAGDPGPLHPAGVGQQLHRTP